MADFALLQLVDAFQQVLRQVPSFQQDPQVVLVQGRVFQHRPQHLGRGVLQAAVELLFGGGQGPVQTPGQVGRQLSVVRAVVHVGIIDGRRAAVKRCRRDIRREIPA